ncbi:MAG: nucleotidyl transferase AbiEii/AbiGii toxin family protein, partial [Deltaproteobacteria bacterium]|nr:nucleotidyl transferase AbiEii/AbiGii toxin family protein [Deltaproteobacteria bacterium]
QHFYLTGGTALAGFYLKHRFSDDLDFFTHSIEISQIDRLFEDTIRGAGFKLEKERSSPTYRRYRIDGELQIDIVRDIDFRVGAPELLQNFMVDTPKNIAVNKVTAIYGRLEPKDYVDLYFLKPLLKYNIMDLIETGKMKDGGLEAFQWAKIISDVDAFRVLPRMLLPLELADLKKFFHQMRDEILDAVRPGKS